MGGSTRVGCAPRPWPAVGGGVHERRSHVGSLHGRRRRRARGVERARERRRYRVYSLVGPGHSPGRPRYANDALHGGLRHALPVLPQPGDLAPARRHLAKRRADHGPGLALPEGHGGHRRRPHHLRRGASAAGGVRDQRLPSRQGGPGHPYGARHRGPAGIAPQRRGPDGHRPHPARHQVGPARDLRARHRPPPPAHARLCQAAFRHGSHHVDPVRPGAGAHGRAGERRGGRGHRGGARHGGARRGAPVPPAGAHQVGGDGGEVPPGRRQAADGGAGERPRAPCFARAASPRSRRADRRWPPLAERAGPRVDRLDE